MTERSRSSSLRWIGLLMLFAAPILIVALTQDIGAHAWDAATEHILRGVAFSDIINDGVLVPRWSQALHWGLGSPLFTFQPPLPYYGMDLLYRLGLPHPLGWQWLMALGYCVAFGGAYLLVQEISGRRWPALVAAIAYTYAPYILKNGLERGSNEAYGTFLYPLVLWSLIYLAKQPTGKRFVLATAIWSACIASHVLAPLMLAPFAGLLALFLWWQHRTAAPLLALLAGGLLTAFIWLPMAPEQPWVHIERDFNKPEAMPAQNPLRLRDLLAAPVVYDVMRGDNTMGERVGRAHMVLLLLGAPAAVVAWRRNRKLAWALLITTATGLFLFYLLTPWSDWLWRIGGPIAARLLYRSRLMGLQAMMAAIVAGLLVAVMVWRWQRTAALAAGLALMLIALPSLYIQYQHPYASFEPPVNLEDVRAMEIRHGGTALTAYAEFTPRWRSLPFDDALLGELGTDFDSAVQPLVNPPDEIAVLAAQVRNQAWDLEIRAARESTATLHLLYYPRWQATLDGQPTELTAQAETGYARVVVPAGEHRLTLRYGRTATETVALAISGITLIVLIILGGWKTAGKGRRKIDGPQSTRRLADAGRPGEPAPSPWLLAGLAGLLIFKFAYIDPTTTWLRCVSTAERVCGASAAVNVPFQGAPTLRGYDVESYDVAPGGEVHVKLFWQAEAGASRPLASFIHVRSSTPEQGVNPQVENGMWAQDERLAWGSVLSNEFVPGKLYRDEYRLTLPSAMPAGEYFLETGWFDPETGEQADVPPESVRAPLRILWRSVLLPNLRVGSAAAR